MGGAISIGFGIADAITAKSANERVGAILNVVGGAAMFLGPVGLCWAWDWDC